MTFLERRKGFGTASMDRRKSYVDVMERVLGNSLPSGSPVEPRRFIPDFRLRRWTVGSTVSNIEIVLLGAAVELPH